ncbi:MAG: PilZ domain-containing protein [Nitrospira sp.]|nr:PilZ domain-containing protein [Nitrospira sp.]HNP30755.1 PilZ domain-containing protein [Nitrospirales bacterium]
MRTSTALKQDFRGLTSTTHEDRRSYRRMSVKPNQVLSVAIRCGQDTVCQGRVLNLSPQGMLVEFADDQIPPVLRGFKVSVKLHYLGDSIWLPGIVRHHKGQKMGFLFPGLTQHPPRADKYPLMVVLLSLSRAVNLP